MKKICIVIAGLLFTSLVYAQEKIDYDPRSLHREIEKRIDTDFSEPVLKEMSSETTNGKFFLLEYNNNSISVKYVYTGRVTTINEFEYFDYFILFDTSCTVRKVTVFNYQSSRGYEITARDWLKQFIGFNASDTMKAGQEVNTISGATISVNSIISNIKNKAEQLNRIVQK